MTSHDSFDSNTARYGQGANVPGQPYEGETLYATPVNSGRTDPPPPTGQPFYVAADAAAHARARASKNSKDQEDFERLCRDIGQGVSQVSEALAQGLSGAGSAIGGVIGQAVEGYRQNQTRAQEQAELARRQAMIDARFGRISSIRTGGIVRCAFGGLLTLSFGSALIEELFSLGTMAALPEWIIGILFTGVFFGLSLKLLISGISRIKAATELGDIRRIMGSREAIPIVDLARLLGQKPQQVASSLKYMLRAGMIPEGRMDDEGTTLMVTNEAYLHYVALREAEQRRRMEEQAKRQAQAAAAPQPAAAPNGMPPKVAAFLKSGRGYLEQFRRLDADIDDAAVSQRIVAIEALVERILCRAEEEPAVIDQLGRFVDYYLPTTVKLLRAYDALEEQGVQGENIESSRREIESTLDVLLQAYEKLLDATFADLSMDVSSEISVLNVVLAQEGLTQSPFDVPPDDQETKG